jgi:integrase
MGDAIKVREELRGELQHEIDSEKRGVGFIEKPPREETLAAYSKRWLTHLHKTGRNRKHVLENQMRLLERFILPFLGAMNVHAMQRSDIVAWMAELGDLKTDDGKQYARWTLVGAWRTLGTMLRDAMVLCDLDKNITGGVRFQVRGLEPKHKDVLTAEELAALLKEMEHESPDIKAMCWVGFTTGMRFGELSALLWSDIDFERGLIHIRKSQVHGVVGPTKTRQYRTVPLHSSVASILRAHETWQKEREVPGLDKGLLFPSNEGGYRFSNVLTKPLSRCASRAGIDKHVTAHTMRRTFNNLARQAAGDIVARAMTGHSTEAMTEHYSHVTLGEKAKAVDAALGKVLYPAVVPGPK